MISPHVTLEFDFIERTKTLRRSVTIRSAIIGGWSARDKAALQHHIDELQQIGVKPPARTPIFYRVSVSRLTQADAIEVIGDASSGEVEYILLNVDGRIWVGVGSDHTDRAIEHMGITVAKQLCDKPISNSLWPLDEIEQHWDKIMLRSEILDGGKQVLYQEGAVELLLSPHELLAHFRSDGGHFGPGMLMFGGTCGAIGGVRFSPRFKYELFDPILNRKIQHAYEIHSVPIEG